ncbi:ABC transporter ATP-binding protein [Floccifex sp.]|uniref:ABC transporter ATP-binding protein n=1 Tax=Floccifex sp. TaxID=2815810 RepID=UPI002A75DC43|nr:ABC transporter ATP-binding protein [Floccifex sp.]MDD7282112.1 ABC transporter ATP-binding protein [Erysipelotrichaceae bacterium]MDY2957440.1 ABC transporter ATP-binding protein [Floccifex sp.]
MNNKKKPNFSSLFRVLKEVISNYKLLAFIVIILILISSITGVIGNTFIKSLVDVYIVPMLSQETPDYMPLFSALSKLACIYLIGVLSSYLWNRLMLNVALGTLNNIRKKLFIHMESLPIQYFDTHAHGDIMSVYTNDVDALRQFISQSIPNLFSSFVTIIAVAISMFVMSPILAIITIAFSLLCIFISKKVTGLSGKYFNAQQRELGQVNGFIEEMIEGTKVIKVFNHEKQSISDFKKVNNQLCEASRNANTYANILMPILGNIGYLSYVVVAIVGSILAINGKAGITVGIIVSFVQLNRSFNGPINQVSQQLNSIIMASAGAKRIYDLIDETPETDNGTVTLVNVKKENESLVECHEQTGHWAWRHVHNDGSIQLVPLKGDVRFNHVTFGYNDKKTVLHDISLFAKPGQKIAFVGATGAGKTTITNLINRFYDIQEGSITYDGIDVKLIKKDDLRHSLGIVLQDVNLFTGTIMDNIRYGNLEATDEQCIAASKLANAHDFIKHLEHGYNTQIVAGQETLSQGQKQLLSIARAAVANPPVLILDEATSSIDTHTEKIVQEGMDKLMAGRTVFVIAHRLSTIQNANAIMVLDNGKIIERGNHDDLMAQKGVYYRLYTGSFEE